MVSQRRRVHREKVSIHTFGGGGTGRGAILPRWRSVLGGVTRVCNVGLCRPFLSTTYDIEHAHQHSTDTFSRMQCFSAACIVGGSTRVLVKSQETSA